jgi:hypothetical protein
MQQRCSNDIHGRSVITIRFCASCGVLVNGVIRPKRCPADSHAQMRRTQNTYCIDCGERIAV